METWGRQGFVLHSYCKIMTPMVWNMLCICSIKPRSTTIKVEKKIHPKTLYGNINEIQKKFN